MPTPRSTRPLRTPAILACLLAAILYGCGHRNRLRDDYSAARPTYAPPAAVHPIRIGGYAGYNYGRAPAIVPAAPVEAITPIEKGEPALGRDAQPPAFED